MFSDETVDRESQQKLYVQIFSIMKGKIEKGEWSSGAQIPTEDDLCRVYDVSKATVRIAVSELVREGYLKRWQGKGTFVLSPAQNCGMAMRTRLTEDMFGEGVRSRKELLDRGVRQPSAEVGGLLGHDDDVYYILCRRVVEDEPAFLEESFLPLDSLPGIEAMDVCSCSFYELVQNKAVRRVSKVVQNIEVSEIWGGFAEALKLTEGSPALLLHRLIVGADGSPIAYTRLFGSGRKYRLQTEFERIR